MPDLLPQLRQDLKLHRSAALADGSPVWRIADPVRNRFFELGWLEFELLSRWRAHPEAGALVAAVARDTTLRPTAQDVQTVAAFLLQHELAAPADAEGLARRRMGWLTSKPALWKQALHHYLFFRIPLFHPDRWLTRMLPYVRGLWTPAFAAVVAVVAAIDLVLLVREWDALGRTFLYFFNLEGLLFYAVAASFAKVIHEFAHAFTAKRYGVRVPTMGVAFLVLWPVLYTDTGETWKLADRRQRFAIASAGIAAELVLAVFATLGWALAPEGPLKSVLFLLATTTWVTTIAINASPFMRFDGYFLASDALDMPNLHERSFALARHWLRRFFFGLDDPQPEADLSPRRRALLIAFAVGTWAYRFVLFLVIAFAVYHLFFKLLGLALMAVEIGWFIVRPLWREAQALSARRAELVPQWRRIGTVAAAAFAVLWLGPVSLQVQAPALVRAAQVQTVYAPVAGQIVEVAVKDGEAVAPGALLARIASPELVSRRTRAEARAQALQVELLRAPASMAQSERRAVTEQQLAEALADRQGAEAELARLELRAQSAGVVRDLAADVVPGRWVNPRQPLLRVVSAQSVIEAYVSESQVRAVAPGQSIRFYPERAGSGAMTGRVTAVDASSAREVAHPLLASVHGGDVASTRGGGHAGKAAYLAHDARYRVEISPPEGTAPADGVVRGTVRINAGLFWTVQDVTSRVVSLFVRESGF
ncbi:MAG: HlyD family efflux transporter periplasmic adaptor subunit [Burkholderiales bacterium]